MNQSGKVSPLTLLGVVALLGVAFLLLFAREGVGSVGRRFMDALASGDVETLTKMTFISNRSEEDIRKDWDFAINTAGRHYRFRYVILSANQANETTASVRMHVWRNAFSPGTFEEIFELPLTKVDGQWKVEITNVNRDMFPGLPSPDISFAQVREERLQPQSDPQG